MQRLCRQCALILAGFSLGSSLAAANRVLINEIHYNPDVKTERVEFVELYNAGTNTVDLGGWYFSDGIQFTFPAGTPLAPGAYKVVAENPVALATKFGYAGALGPYAGGLSKYGEKIALRDSAGEVENEVDYQLGFPWPTVGDAPGYSIELIDPALDNDLGGSWRASVAGAVSQQSQQVFIQTNSGWKYFKGTQAASAPTTAWRVLAFNDSGWSNGLMPIGYGSAGDPAMATPLPDMRSNYTSVFFRKTFVVDNPGLLTSLALDALYDDGFKAWINGTKVRDQNMSTNEVPFDGTALQGREDNNYYTFSIDNPATFLVPGTNILTLQAHNNDLSSSSDFFLNVGLRGHHRPLRPRPHAGPHQLGLCHQRAAANPPGGPLARHSPQRPGREHHRQGHGSRTAWPASPWNTRWWRRGSTSS